LLGGNDGHNLVIPLDQYGSYAASRRELALPSSGLLQAHDEGSGSLIGFHPSMAHVRALFDAGKLAVVANVGSRSREYNHHEISDLSYLRGGFLTARWAERMVGSATITGFASVNQHSSLTLSGRGLAERQTDILGQSNSSNSAYKTSFPETCLGRQLARIACLMASGVTKGVRQRVFFAAQGGYDTHSNQLARQATQLAELSEAIDAFHAATVEMGVSRQVTIYTDSDFGRTLKPNKLGGSDHGWGAHQLVIGGSVVGGRVYGSFPDLRLGSTRDVTSTGVWRPETGKDQHAATIAAWAGASDADLEQAFPNLESRQPTLTFRA
jgi:uncharacterized protein (DUF1501 family)